MRFIDDDPSRALAPGTDALQMAALFNDGPASRRVFSEVHYHQPADPHLTVGMGHFIEGNLAELFARLRGDTDTWTFLLATWSAALSGGQWQQMASETGIAAATGPEALERALDRVLCASEPGSTCVSARLRPWADRVGDGFNSNSNWFTAGWKAVCRAEPVARHQLEEWRSSVLDKGVAEAAKRGQTTRGGIACVISAASSGIGTIYPAGAKEAGVAGHAWSLTEVPAAARPGGGKVSEEELLADWRAVVAWQFYTLKKQRVRSRMAAIWKTFYAASWGPAPKTLEEAASIPRHLGVAMDDRAFDFRIEISGG